MSVHPPCLQCRRSNSFESYAPAAVIECFTAAGICRSTKLKFVPRPSDFLIDELRERLSKVLVKFDVLALLGEAGDGSSDPSQTWTNEDKRKTVKMATLSIVALEDNAACNATFFNPTHHECARLGVADEHLVGSLKLAAH
jgi:hypothetical protein